MERPAKYPSAKTKNTGKSTVIAVKIIVPVISRFCRNIEPQGAANATVTTLVVMPPVYHFVILLWSAKPAESRGMKYWELIADNLSKAGWSWGCVATMDREGQTIFVADAHRDDGNRFVVRADEKLTAFLELGAAIRRNGVIGRRKQKPF